MTAEQQALRFYSDHMPIVDDYHMVDPTDHYYPIIRHKEYLLLHARSIVSFCHRFGPQALTAVTQKTFREEFYRHCTLSIKGITASFRMIREDEWNQFVREI